MYWLVVSFFFSTMSFATYHSKADCELAGLDIARQSWFVRTLCVPMPNKENKHDHDHDE